MSISQERGEEGKGGNGRRVGKKTRDLLMLSGEEKPNTTIAFIMQCDDMT